MFDAMIEKIERNGQADNCRSLDEIVARYEQIDAMFDQIRREGRVRRAREVRPLGFRETGAVEFHVNRACEPVFASRGHHRLAAAVVLGLPEMPGRVGVVHRAALPYWRARFRAGRQA